MLRENYLAGRLNCCPAKELLHDVRMAVLQTFLYEKKVSNIHNAESLDVGYCGGLPARIGVLESV